MIEGVIIINIINNSTNPVKTYEISENESVFFERLQEKIIYEKLKSPLCLTRLSNGTINVNYGSYPIGKIKLQGKSTHMQILKTVYKIDIIENNTLEEYINHIADWIKYIRKL